ncbi:hypothetical protein [Cochleicola gelatinilyticus]|uniref:Uncharacterized protein n=1 Tax=Cochleicola gelatinilyticus TaxID=1763537 RepID=A0A167IES2_9FLAO|nr:hypothetical protein [Cochleicola gelatinilyticus]OAB79579.1 hypothetical protein ULVI_02165 [Cochleicola gelatinilyticus]
MKLKLQNLIKNNNPSFAYRIVMILAVFSFSSCENDYFEGEVQNTINYGNEISVIDGRMYFPNREVFVETFKGYADESNDKIFSYMSKHYNNDFVSLRIPVTENNEEEVLKIYEKKIELLPNGILNRSVGDLYDDIDDLEDIIGDDAFSAFLNSDAEIQVADKIYKYTDVGLFFTTVNKYNILEEYLAIKNISNNLLVPTLESARQLIESEIPNAGETSLMGGDLRYYITPCNQEPGNQDRCLSTIGSSGNGNGGNGGNNGGGSQSVPLEGLEPYLNSLDICDSRNGLFGTLFGTNKICIDQYESKRRVKTKVFNYNYYLVYHIGAKVKHQKKGWTGIWRQEDTDIVAAGIEMAQFEYDYTPIVQPDLSYVLNNRASYSYKPLNIKYNVESGIYNSPTGYAPYTYLNQETWISSNHYPRVFWDDLTIEYTTKNSVLDYGISQFDKNFTSQKLNELFWNSVYNNVRNQLRDFTNNNSFEPPKNITLISNHPGYGKLLVQKTYFSNCANCSKRERTFDFDGSAQVGVSFNGNTGKFNFSGGTGELITPESLRVKMFGVAKRNGTWHGSKMEVGIE